MALSAFIGLLCGLVVSIGVSAYFDYEIVAICLPSLILLLLTIGVASRAGVFDALSRTLSLQLLVFACSVTLGTLVCGDNHWGQFGLPPEARSLPGVLSMAMNTLVSVSITTPIIFIFEICVANRLSEYRPIEKMLAIPGFCSAMYLIAALPAVLLLHHCTHSSCFGVSGDSHNEMVKEALKLVIGLATFALSSAGVFLSIIMMRKIREQRRVG